MSRLGTRILLLTLDAFGTLYRPRRSIALQYLDVARSWSNWQGDEGKGQGTGTGGFNIEASLDEFSQSFKTAFRKTYARYPNYGRSNGIGVEAWWDQVVRGTFAPLMSRGTEWQGITGEGANGNGEGGRESESGKMMIPDGLSAALFQHFSGAGAYELFPDVIPFLDQIERWRRIGEAKGDELMTVVGVLTNSDPRVSGVLESLNVRIGASESRSGMIGVRNDDLDFVLTSYEVGCEKPSLEMFEEAEKTAMKVLGLSDAIAQDAFLKVHIGDDLSKDYWGALGAGRGWDAILLDRDSGHAFNDHHEDSHQNAASPYQDIKRITQLTDAQPTLTSLLRRFQKHG